MFFVCLPGRVTNHRTLEYMGHESWDIMGYISNLRYDWFFLVYGPIIFPWMINPNDKSQWIDDDHPPKVIRIQVNCLTHLSHPRMLFCGCVCFGLRLHIYIFIYLYMCLLLLQHSHEVPGENTCPKQPLILDTTELDLRRLFRTGKNAETSKGIACVLARMLRVQSPRFLSA